MLLNIDGRSVDLASRGTEAGIVAEVPSRALGAAGSGSVEITVLEVWAGAVVANVGAFSKLVVIEAFKVSVILSNLLLIASPSLSSNWLSSVPGLCKGVEGVGFGHGSCLGVFTVPG